MGNAQSEEAHGRHVRASGEKMLQTPSPYIVLTLAKRICVSLIYYVTMGRI